MLKEARRFFAERSILEVDCPALTQYAPVDEHIDIMSLSPHRGEKRYLHSSPEYGMKRLLAEGSGDIYQLSHVFRDGEFGALHNPEFMMAEWYRTSLSFAEMVQETISFIQLFLGELPTQQCSYKELFARYTGLDSSYASKEELVAYLQRRNLHLASHPEGWDRDALLALILGSLIEPQLGRDSLFIITDFPKTQAALAQIKGEVAMRFEIYHQGIELANGYHELGDAKEQLRRQLLANQKRTESGKSELPIDHYLIEALDKGFPDCCGVAVGFDRLMMLRHNEKRLAPILPFPWDKA